MLAAWRAAVMANDDCSAKSWLGVADCGESRASCVSTQEDERATKVKWLTERARVVVGVGGTKGINDGGAARSSTVPCGARGDLVDESEAATAMMGQAWSHNAG